MGVQVQPCCCKSFFTNGVSEVSFGAFNGVPSSTSQRGVVSASGYIPDLYEDVDADLTEQLLFYTDCHYDGTYAGTYFTVNSVHVDGTGQTKLYQNNFLNTGYSYAFPFALPIAIDTVNKQVYFPDVNNGSAGNACGLAKMAYDGSGYTFLSATASGLPGTGAGSTPWNIAGISVDATAGKIFYSLTGDVGSGGSFSLGVYAAALDGSGPSQLGTLIAYSTTAGGLDCDFSAQVVYFLDGAWKVQQLPYGGGTPSQVWAPPPGYGGTGLRVDHSTGRLIYCDGSANTTRLIYPTTGTILASTPSGLVSSSAAYGV